MITTIVQATSTNECSHYGSIPASLFVHTISRGDMHDDRRLTFTPYVFHPPTMPSIASPILCVKSFIFIPKLNKVLSANKRVPLPPLPLRTPSTKIYAPIPHNTGDHLTTRFSCHRFPSSLFVLLTHTYLHSFCHLSVRLFTYS